MRHLFYLILSTSLCLASCKDNKSKSANHKTTEGDTLTVDYATGFSVIDHDSYKILNVENPYPDADKTYSYVLVQGDAKLPEDLDYDDKIQIPVENIVVTSTTHIPSLESLEETKSLVGFPNPDYISSEKTRKRIDSGAVKNIGENENLNTEILLNLNPDVVVGFSIKGENKTYKTITKKGIPVVYNGDWNEENPLGKAEWIKFFGALYDKEAQADSIFNHIETEYQEARQKAAEAEKTPSVLSGALQKDVWNAPKGESWAAQLIKDAHGGYVFGDTEGTGSLSLSIENVLDEAKDAKFWVAPGSFTRYDQMENASKHYTKFSAFKTETIYSYAGKTGETGGVLFYELGPNRPDLVLKDLIHIFHPDLLEDYENTFYQPLK